MGSNAKKNKLKLTKSNKIISLPVICVACNTFIDTADATEELNAIL
jgi:hypothetical protein